MRACGALRLLIRFFYRSVHIIGFNLDLGDGPGETVIYILTVTA